MPEDEIEYDFPWVPAGLLLALLILGALMKAYNWTPFW